MDDEENGLDPAGVGTLIAHVFDLWVNPALINRGLALSRADIEKVVVELEPDGAPRVRINEETELVATIVTTRAIAKGEAVTLGDIEALKDLRPVVVGPNSGWLCFARIGGQEVVAFDFTYNRARASKLIARAGEFLTVAREAASVAVAVDNAHSAAELAVQAQMLVMQLETRRHQERREWLAGWAKHQNAPREHADMLWNLAQLRPAARYGVEDVRLKPGRLDRILSTVEDMIELAATRVVAGSDASARRNEGE